MRIIARPAHANYKTDPGNSVLYAEIEKLPSVQVKEGSIRNLLWERGDVLHIHWPDNVLRDRRWLFSAIKMFALFFLISYRRLRGTKIVWTAHNAHSHEHHHPRLERMFWRMLFRRLHGVISHSEAVKADLLQRMPAGIPIVVIPLSHFGDMYPKPSLITKDDALRLGFIGRIRLYKGVPDLVASFKEYTGTGTRLVIRGKPEDSETARGITDLCAGDDRIDLRLGFLSPQDLVNEIASSDAIVLPFKWVTNSGSALLALSLGTRVVVPKTDYFLEIQREFGPEWVFCYEGDLNGSIVNTICAWAHQPTPCAKPTLSERRGIPWAARSTVAFFESVVSPTKTHSP